MTGPVWTLSTFTRGQLGSGPEQEAITLTGSEAEVRTAYRSLLPTATTRHAVRCDGILKSVSHYGKAMP